MRWITSACLVLFGGLLSGCMTGTPPAISDPISAQYTTEDFLYCAGEGCQDPRQIGFTEAEWDAVEGLFARPAETAAEERAQIASAVALLEATAGPKAGTADDEGGTPTWWPVDGQIDCFSEASNTSNFIGLMQRRGLLRHHRISEPRLRGWPFTASTPMLHATAVVEETDTSAHYAIDSWYFDNGELPNVVALETWLDGWRPPDRDEG